MIARRDVLKLALGAGAGAAPVAVSADAIAEAPRPALRGFGLLAVYGRSGYREFTAAVEEWTVVRGPNGRWTLTLPPEVEAALDALAGG